MLKRHEIQVLRRAEHTWSEIAALSGVSEKTARRIAAEGPVTSVDNAAARSRRQVGRPSKAAAHRDVLVQALMEDPSLKSVELLHRARQAGYTGGKSALYALAQTLRSHTVTPLVRFEGLPLLLSERASPIARRIALVPEVRVLVACSEENREGFGEEARQGASRRSGNPWHWRLSRLLSPFMKLHCLLDVNRTLDRIRDPAAWSTRMCRLKVIPTICSRGKTARVPPGPRVKSAAAWRRG